MNARKQKHNPYHHHHQHSLPHLDFIAILIPAVSFNTKIAVIMYSPHGKTSSTGAHSAASQPTEPPINNKGNGKGASKDKGKGRSAEWHDGKYIGYIEGYCKGWVKGKYYFSKGKDCLMERKEKGLLESECQELVGDDDFVFQHLEMSYWWSDDDDDDYYGTQWPRFGIVQYESEESFCRDDSEYGSPKAESLSASPTMTTTARCAKCHSVWNRCETSTDPLCMNCRDAERTMAMIEHLDDTM